MRTLSHGDVIAALTPAEAVEAIRQPLLDGFDPVTDPHRQKVPLPHGEMHLLPSALGGDGRFFSVPVGRYRVPGCWWLPVPVFYPRLRLSGLT